MITKLENGIEYILENDIWYPNLTTNEEGIELGRYGLMRKRFIEEHYKIRYETMLIKGQLFCHCKEVEVMANKMRDRLVQQYMDCGYDSMTAYLLTEEFVVHELIFA